MRDAISLTTAISFKNSRFSSNLHDTGSARDTSVQIRSHFMIVNMKPRKTGRALSVIDTLELTTIFLIQLNTI